MKRGNKELSLKDIKLQIIVGIFLVLLVLVLGFSSLNKQIINSCEKSISKFGGELNSLPPPTGKPKIPPPQLPNPQPIIVNGEDPKFPGFPFAVPDQLRPQMTNTICIEDDDCKLIDPCMRCKNDVGIGPYHCAYYNEIKCGPDQHIYRCVNDPYHGSIEYDYIIEKVCVAKLIIPPGNTFSYTCEYRNFADQRVSANCNVGGNNPPDDDCDGKTTSECIPASALTFEEDCLKHTCDSNGEKCSKDTPYDPSKTGRACFIYGEKGICDATQKKCVRIGNPETGDPTATPMR